MGLQKIKKVIYDLNKYFNMFGIVLLLLMIIFVIVDISSRLLFNNPLSASYELVEYTMALVIVFALGYTQVKKGHINVMTIIELLPVKLQILCERIVNTIGLIMFSLIAWQTFVKAGMDEVAGITSPVLFIPRYPFVYAVAVGFTLICLVLFIQIISPKDELDKKKEDETETIF